MNLSTRGKAIRIALFACTFVLFALGALMVHGSDSKLFYEPQTVLTPENAELVQKSQANLSNIVRVFSNELVAERARVQAIRKLSDDLGKALLFLSAIQFGLLVIWRPQITVALLGKGPDVE